MSGPTNNSSLEPVSNSVYCSYMDPSLEITEDWWAVSMTVENKLFSMHTVLLIETIQENKRINFKAHLMGPGTLKDKRPIPRDVGSPFCCWSIVPQVDIGQIRDVIDPSRYRSRYETWLVARDRVQKMMDEIREEKEHPEAITRPFHIFGERSIFAPKRIDFDIDDERLLEMRQREPEKFKKMYTFYNESKAVLAHEIEDLDVPMKYPLLKIMAFIAKPFLKSIDEGINEEKPLKVLGTMAGYVVVVLPIHLVLGIPALAIDLPRMAYESEKMRKDQDLLDLFEKHVNKIELASQNCFNWARCKLATIDVIVEERPSERFTTIPTSYFPDRGEPSRQRQENLV